MQPESSAKPDSQGPAKVVRRVAGYQLISRLGEGGTGTVFKARQPGLERDVALKILSPELAQQTEYLQRFRNEARAAARVNHSNMVQVLAAGFDDAISVPYIVYEFVDGVTLTRLLEERGSLTEREALAVTKAIGDALGHLSREGLVHRDVKPDNILITRDGIPKLTDLGLAKQESDLETITATGIVMGTPDYMAPEQAMGQKDLSLTTDYYALGLTLYVMLTAQLPYSGETLVEILTKHIQEDCPDPRTISPWVSAGTAKLVAGLTRRKPQQRYGDAPTLLRDIDLLLAGKPIIGPSLRPAASRRPAQPSSRPGARAPGSKRHPDPGPTHRPTSARSQGRAASARSSAEGRSLPKLGEELSGTAPRRRDSAPQQSPALTPYLLALIAGAGLALIVFRGPWAQRSAPPPDPQRPAQGQR